MSFMYLKQKLQVMEEIYLQIYLKKHTVPQFQV